MAALTTPNDDDAIEAIATDTALRREAREAIAIVGMRGRRAATRDEIRNIIGRRFITFIQPEREHYEWRPWWEDYFVALSGLSAEAIEAAMLAWIAKPDSEFLPKPGPLRQLAQAQTTTAARSVNLMRRGIDTGDERERAAHLHGDFKLENPVSPRRMPTRDERAEVSRSVAEFVAQHRSREPVEDQVRRRRVARPASPPFPPTATDEGGLTPVMRELMARRAAGATEADDEALGYEDHAKRAGVPDWVEQRDARREVERREAVAFDAAQEAAARLTPGDFDDAYWEGVAQKIGGASDGGDDEVFVP